MLKAIDDPARTINDAQKHQAHITMYSKQSQRQGRMTQPDALWEERGEGSDLWRPLVAPTVTSQRPLLSIQGPQLSPFPITRYGHAHWVSVERCSWKRASQRIMCCTPNETGDSLGAVWGGRKGHGERSGHSNRFHPAIFCLLIIGVQSGVGTGVGGV